MLGANAAFVRLLKLAPPSQLPDALPSRTIVTSGLQFSHAVITAATSPPGMKCTVRA